MKLRKIPSPTPHWKRWGKIAACSGAAMDGNGAGTHDLCSRARWKSCLAALALLVYRAASIPNRISHVRSNESQTRRTPSARFLAGISLPGIHLRSERNFHLCAFPERILPLFLSLFVLVFFFSFWKGIFIIAPLCSVIAS